MLYLILVITHHIIVTTHRKILVYYGFEALQKLQAVENYIIAPLFFYIPIYINIEYFYFEKIDYFHFRIHNMQVFYDVIIIMAPMNIYVKKSYHYFKKINGNTINYS